MIYVSSDHHFFDSNYLYYNNRKFLGRNIISINKSLIKRQNDQITNNDIIYYIGDLSSGSVKNTLKILERLNGKRINILIGNHDKFSNYNVLINNKIKILDKTIYTLNYNSYVFKLFHYPLYEQPEQYNGAIHLHGHTHGKVKYNNNAIDVGYDNNNFRLLSMEDILQKINE